MKVTPMALHKMKSKSKNVFSDDKYDCKVHLFVSQKITEMNVHR